MFISTVLAAARFRGPLSVGASRRPATGTARTRAAARRLGVRLRGDVADGLPMRADRHDLSGGKAAALVS
jgi:hypothetical protein